MDSPIQQSLAETVCVGPQHQSWFKRFYDPSHFFVLACQIKFSVVPCAKLRRLCQNWAWHFVGLSRPGLLSGVTGSDVLQYATAWEFGASLLSNAEGVCSVLI